MSPTSRSPHSAKILVIGAVPFVGLSIWAISGANGTGSGLTVAALLAAVGAVWIGISFGVLRLLERWGRPNLALVATAAVLAAPWVLIGLVKVFGEEVQPKFSTCEGSSVPTDVTF